MTRGILRAKVTLGETVDADRILRTAHALSALSTARIETRWLTPDLKMEFMGIFREPDGVSVCFLMDESWIDARILGPQSGDTLWRCFERAFAPWIGVDDVRTTISKWHEGAVNVDGVRSGFRPLGLRCGSREVAIDVVTSFLSTQFRRRGLTLRDEVASMAAGDVAVTPEAVFAEEFLAFSKFALWSRGQDHGEIVAI